MEEIIAAVIGGLAFGFAAIPHCYGMCGPLHISVCALNRTQSLRSLTLFNLGRISGYTMAGILFGGLGEFINIGPSNYCCQLDIFPFRGALLALLFPGVMMFWIGYMGWKKKGIPVPKTGWLARFLTGGRAKLAAGGACTTFIPCGMLYAAFALAVGCGSWVTGGLFMASFVITQTFFMQLGISMGRLLSRSWSERFEKMFPALCFIVGLIYILLFIRRLSPA